MASTSRTGTFEECADANEFIATLQRSTYRVGFRAARHLCGLLQACRIRAVECRRDPAFLQELEQGDAPTWQRLNHRVTSLCILDMHNWLMRRNYDFSPWKAWPVIQIPG